MLIMLEITELNVFESTQKFAHAFRTPERACNEFEIECLLSGNGRAIIDGTAYVHTPGMIICAPPGTIRYSEGEFSCFYVHFKADKDIEKILSGVPRCVISAEAEPVKRKFITLIELYHSHGAADRLRLESEMFELFRLIYLCGQPHTLQSGIFNKAVDFMHENYMHDISLVDIANAVNLSPSYFHRQFRAVFGKTPREELLSVRMAAAKRMLLCDDFSLFEIAEKCGFQSQSYFQYCFKKENGITPGEFREQRFVFGK